MAKKYSINRSGYAIAERDIHSLGGLVPKGSQGAKLASEDQLSQFGECWVRTGDLTNYPGVRIKDDAYIDEFRAAASVISSTVIISGGTRIIPPFRQEDLLAHKPSLYIHNSEIAATVESLTLDTGDTPTSVGFAQGVLDATKVAGTPLTGLANAGNMNTVYVPNPLVVSKKTRLMGIPSGKSARVLFLYWSGGAFYYSGAYRDSVNGILDVSSTNHVYAVVHITGSSPLAPSGVSALGCSFKDLSQRAFLSIFRGYTAGKNSVTIADSGIYLRRSTRASAAAASLNLSGGLFNCPEVKVFQETDVSVMGTFKNCEYIDIATAYILAERINDVNSDRFISAYNCPLLRLNSTTMTRGLVQKADLVLRNCIVPKAMFVDDVVNGNTYEGIDFSYANAHLGIAASDSYNLYSAHKEGLYNVVSGSNIHAQVSYPGNLGPTARVRGKINVTPLNGVTVEQGYFLSSVGVSFEASKAPATQRVRSVKMINTKVLQVPIVPAGYSIIVYYYSETGLLEGSVSNPASIDTTKAYAAFTFNRTDNTALTLKDFAALNLSMTSFDFSQVPQVTGSGYVGAGVTASGDVQVHGLPYVERVFDADTFEQGLVSPSPQVGKTWDELKEEHTIKSQYVRIKQTIPVQPGGVISIASGGVSCFWFNAAGKLVSFTSYLRTNTVPAGIAYAGMIVAKTPLSPIVPSDVAAASLKYVNAFPTRRYITNALDRVAAWDTLLGPEMWSNSYINDSPVGAYYKNLLTPNAQWISSIRPINARKPTTISGAGSYWQSKDLDPKTKLLPSVAGTENTFLGLRLRRDPISNISPNFAIDSRLVVTFVNAPRIVVPYGVANIYIESKVRLYDNAVLGTSVFGKAITLTGDAVLGEVPGYEGDPCVCAQGEGDANIKYP